MNQFTEKLQQIGLTQQEAKVYLGLLELQEARTGALCRTTGIRSSNIYAILEVLIQKGLASYRMQNNIKMFMPASPDSLNELYLEKQRKLDEECKAVTALIATLKKQEVKQPYAKYKYFEGMRGIKAMWHEINSMMTKESVIKVHTAKKESYERLVGFYDLHHAMRERKEISEQLIFPVEDRELAQRRMNRYTEIRFLDLKNNAEWGVVHDRMFIQHITGKEPRGFLIQDEIFARTFTEVFDRLWEVAQH